MHTHMCTMSMYSALMNVHIHICMYSTCVHASLCTCICRHVYIHTHVNVCTMCMHAYTYLCAHVCTYVYACTACVYTCIHEYTNMHMQ